MASSHELSSVDQVDLEEPQQLLERETQAAFEPRERQPQGRDSCDPNWGHDRMFGGARKGFDLQMRFDRRAAQLDLPPCFLSGRHRGGGQMQGRGPEHLVVASRRGTAPHPPERVRVGRAVLPSQADVLV